MKNPTKVKQGKTNRRLGKAFEVLVRKDLEKKSWIVNRWNNNLNLIQEDIGEFNFECVQSKPKFNPFTKSLMMNTSGFPDYVCHKTVKFPELLGPKRKENWKIVNEEGKTYPLNEYENKLFKKFYFNLNTLIKDCHFEGEDFNMVIFIECKINGTLEKLEKEKAKWYLANNYCSKFLIASKSEKEIIYKEFK